MFCKLSSTIQLYVLLIESIAIWYCIVQYSMHCNTAYCMNTKFTLYCTISFTIPCTILYEYIIKHHTCNCTVWILYLYNTLGVILPTDRSPLEYRYQNIHIQPHTVGENWAIIHMKGNRKKNIFLYYLYVIITHVFKIIFQILSNKLLNITVLVPVQVFTID